MKNTRILLIISIAGMLILWLSACQSEPVVVTEQVVVTATAEPVEPMTFTQMVTEAMEEVPVISSEEARQLMEQEPNVLVIDPRDAADIPLTGIIPGAMNISYGALTYRADNELPEEWREPELADRSRPIITACETGEIGALSGKLLQDMGFSNVYILEGGTLGWIDAGFPVEEFEPGT